MPALENKNTFYDDDARSGHPPEPNCSHCGAFNIALYECCNYVRDDGTRWNPHYCSKVCKQAEWINRHYVGGGHHRWCTNRGDDDSVDAMPEARKGRFGLVGRCGCPTCVDFCDGCDRCRPQ